MGRRDDPLLMPLPDGRGLSFAVYGPPDGRPLVLCHGLPGSRRQHPPDIEHLARLGVRLIVPERPGLGYSDPQTGRRLLDWPDDLARLVDHLGVGRFALIGVSGGAPYALACAWRASPHRPAAGQSPALHALAGRIAAVGIVSGMGPTDQNGWAALSRRSRLILGMARRTPWLLRLPLAALGRLARAPRRKPRSKFPRDPRYGPRHDAGKLVGLLFGLGDETLPAADRAILARPLVGAQMRADLAEAFRQGAGGVVQELALLARPWGFRLEDITLPVSLWHGEADGIVPVTMARQVKAALATPSATVLPGAGHFLIYDRWPEIVARILGDWP